MTLDSPAVAVDKLEELLFGWQLQCADRGEDVPAEEFCRECPELAPELARRLQAIRKVEGLLAAHAGRSGDTTRGQAASPVTEVSPGEERAPSLPGYGPFEWVARGGMGAVYRARHLALDRMEAVKTMRTGDFAGPTELARFRFEAEAAAKLSHPNIVTVYGVGESEGRPYLAMQWIDGGNLAARPRDPAMKTALLLEKVARAIDYAHGQFILHRDLKPHNILLDAVGEPYVADFGIARPLDRVATMTEVRSPVGTPAYMSPEQTRCEPRLTKASDVFSLGVVLYERVTGRLPFTGANHFEVMRKVREAEPILPRVIDPTLSRDLEAICMKCLEKDPQDRYSGADQLADDLGRFRRGEPVMARPPGVWDWLRQLARTRPEPNADYSWPVTVWFGAIVLAMHSAIYAFVRTGGSASAVWAVNASVSVGMSVILWWYMLRKFRRLPATERHSLIIAAGTIVVYLALTFAYVPLSTAAPAGEALGMYPALAAVCGLGLFVLGSTNWSRFFPIGLAVIVLAPALARWPEVSPLIFGGAIAAVLWYWSYVKKVTFAKISEET